MTTLVDQTSLQTLESLLAGCEEGITEDVCIMYECLKHPDRYNSVFSENSGWRWPLFQATLEISAFFLIVELFLNKYKLIYKHVFFVLIASSLYVFVNFSATYFLSKSELYPNLTVWNLNKSTTPATLPGHNYWTDLGVFLVIWLGGTTTFSFLWTLCHHKTTVKESEKQNSDESDKSNRLSSVAGHSHD